jgi:hypothetical protein
MSRGHFTHDERKKQSVIRFFAFLFGAGEVVVWLIGTLLAAGILSWLFAIPPAATLCAALTLALFTAFQR